MSIINSELKKPCYVCTGEMDYLCKRLCTRHVQVVLDRANRFNLSVEKATEDERRAYIASQMFAGANR